MVAAGLAASMLALPRASLAQTAPGEPAPAMTMPGLSILGQPYVRADIGGAFSFDQHYRDTDPDAPNALLGPGGKIAGGVDPTGAFDVGVGWRTWPWFRWDATLSYIPSMDFSGTIEGGPGGLATANVDSLVGMVNGYVDLAGLGYSFGPFQPYLDGGIGGASNHLHTMDTTTAGIIGGDTNTSFAWGIGGGVGMPLSPRTTLDVSYKYLDLGEARSSSTDTLGTIQPLKADVRTNLVMAGLRYAF
jgi:opacity protein-like surface antigen